MKKLKLCNVHKLAIANEGEGRKPIHIPFGTWAYDDTIDQTLDREHAEAIAADLAGKIAAGEPGIPVYQGHPDVPECFNSRPSCDGRPVLSRLASSSRVSIHARLATGDIFARCFCHIDRVSIHARLATGDSSFGLLSLTWVVSIHARLATGDRISRHFVLFLLVSIHARLATGDESERQNAPSTASFNSRPSCDGRPDGEGGTEYLRVFQFTPVLRRATEACGMITQTSVFQFTPVVSRRDE